MPDNVYGAFDSFERKMDDANVRGANFAGGGGAATAATAKTTSTDDSPRSQRCRQGKVEAAQ